MMAVFALLLLSACVPDSSLLRQEPASRQSHRLPVYYVNRGETLYSIAWRFRLDHKQIAYWNTIRPPFVIYRGQKLYLAAPPGKSKIPPTAKKVAVVRQPIQQQPAPIKQPGLIPPKPAIVKQSPVQAKVAATKQVAQPIKWQMPAKGKIVANFNGVSGLDIRGKAGSSIVASASGKVVYAGSGLKGYGELVIIKHDDIYLSAYAHNRRVTVAQGDRVFAGQKIAEMGNHSPEKPLLHFEIRKNGNPVNPQHYMK